MSSLFYNIVGRLTDKITGLNSGEGLGLSEFFRWMDTCNDMKLVSNLICLVLVITVSCSVYKLTKYIMRKVNSKKVESLA